MTENNMIPSVLHNMQKTLSCPKEQTNNFGGFKYRNCEDILAAVKDVLPDGCAITLSDEIINIGDRYYVKACATLISGTESVGCSAYAREPLTKKGMDEPQLSGTASSYARKYALCGLFAIDDSKTEPAHEIMKPSPDVDSDFSTMSELNDIKIALLDCETLEDLTRNATNYANAYKDEKVKNHIRSIFAEIKKSKFKTGLK